MTGASANRDWVRWAWLLLGAYLLVYLALLGFRPLMRLDEFRYAAAAQEMLATGDWITPHLNGLRYFEKPILGYWTGAAALGLFGENAFAVRLTSALATGLTAGFLGLFLARFTDRRTGVLAAFIFLGCLFVYGIGTTNILDPLLNLWLTLAVGFCYLAQEASGPGRRAALLAVAGLWCGLAFLTKGFLAFAVPVVVAVPYLAWRRQWARLLTDAWPAVLAALLVALPWALAINAREPDYWHYFFWVEHVQRFLSDDAQHGEPPWYFLVRFPALALPWICLVPAAVAGLRSRPLADRRLLVYLLLWLAMPLLFFSASRGKLISYVLPCMPAFAMLVALGLRGPATAGRDRLERAGVAALALLLVAAAAYLALNGLGIAGRPLYQPDETWHWLAGAAAFGAGGVVAALGWSPARARLRPGLVGSSLLAVMVAVQFVLPRDMLWSKAPGEFLAGQAAATGSDAVVVADGALFRAVNWTFRRHDVYLLDPGELEYGLGYADATYRLLDTPAKRAALIRRYNNHRELIFVTKDSREGALGRELPADARRVQWGEAVVWRVPARQGAAPAGSGPSASSTPVTQ